MNHAELQLRFAESAIRKYIDNVLQLEGVDYLEAAGYTAEEWAFLSRLRDGERGDEERGAKWVDHPPAEPGLYWYADESGAHLCQVTRQHPVDRGEPYLVGQIFGQGAVEYFRIDNPYQPTVWWSEPVLAPPW